ncbi:cohesin-loading factor complex subunit SCC2 Ecym_4186 [Eremothecium cymbalariae DBVPG|uniref:Sister chromatid cohesion protein n=1 Tax=Eremothecium cymbalariae (strain CBS 270.75 / DBVPG 7215 / KCTC 17166 / NRRL Y-17582) TaxID=931890 RepID=G8JTA9_ERECY|nr:hypothetical protein Ecym_4186 [Eremothecium cymbalariae DBVPG\
MSSFPGEDTEIPKRVAEALAHQPLNHLVPKNELSKLISDPISLSLQLEAADAFEPIPAELLDDSHPISVGSNKSNDLKTLKFKRPRGCNLNKLSEGVNQGSTSDDLSNLAETCLSITAMVESEAVIESPMSNAIKRNHDVFSDKIEMVEMVKKEKLLNSNSSISLNQVSLGTQYLKELMVLMEYVGTDEASAQLGDLEYWIPLDSGNAFMLSKQCLGKLHVVFRNILTTPSVWATLNISFIQRIMDVCINNISIAKEKIEIKDELFDYQSFAFESSIIVFLIFLLDQNDMRLYLEQYMVVPIEFLISVIENLHDEFEIGSKNVENTLSSLHSTLSLFPIYISKRPTLDESFVTKLVYMFSELIMANWSHNSNTVLVQNQIENVKTVSIQSIEMIFEKFPEQRMFVIDELLSHLDNLPTTRSQKRMKNIAKSIYITHFTFTLLSVLQVWNNYDYCSKLDNLDKEQLKDVITHYNGTKLDLDIAIDYIIETILKKTFSNISKYRIVLDHFVCDLTSIVMLPNWPISDVILAPLLKKLFLVFNPQSQNSINVESLALHEIGCIGSKILDIRQSAKPEEDNNLIKIFNYPEHINTLIDAFERCILYCKSTKKPLNSIKFLWSKQVTALVKLMEFDKDSELWNSKLNDKLCSIIKEIHSNPVKMENVNTTDLDSMYACTLFTSDLVNAYEPYLNLVLSLLDRQKVKLRSGAIRCLALLISKDKNMLSTPIVKETIQCRLQDSSPLVKDAILELIELGSDYTQFYEHINVNYSDDSVLVRKHVLKMNLKIYDDTDDLTIKAYVANRVLRRIEDEEDVIIDIARSELLKRWLLSIHDSERNPNIYTPKCEESIKVISQVVSSSEKSRELFEQFLVFYILNKHLHIHEEYNKIIESLQILTDHIIEMAIEQQSDENNNVTDSTEGRSIMKLLSIISCCDEPFVTKEQIASLYPYLHADNKSDFQLNILRVYRSSFEKLSNFKPRFLYDLETTILSRLPKMNVKELDEAIPLAWSLTVHRKDDTRICKACASCLGQLTPYINSVTKDPSSVMPDGKLQRLLYLATGFARFCSFENTEEKFPNLKSKERVFEYVTKCLLMFTKEGINHVIRRIATKNLVKIASKYPKLFNSRHVLTVLDVEFEKGPLDIQLVVLESLYDFFLAEEKRSIKLAGVNGTVSSNEELRKMVLLTNKMESLNDGICSALVSRYLEKILDICLITDLSNALVAIRFLKLILRYGYTNPSLCIPTVIALMASPNTYMRNLAYEMLMELFQGYESMVFNGLGQGIKLGSEYAIKSRPLQYYEDSGFLRRIQELMSTNKKNKSKFLKSVKRVFLNLLSSRNALGQIFGSNVTFLVHNLSIIYYDNQYEVYEMIKSIDILSDNLKDIISDRIPEFQNSSENTSELSSLIVAKLAIKEFRRFLFEKYHLSETKLLSIGTSDEDDLKNKIVPVLNGTSETLQKDSIFLGYESPFNTKEFCENYINAISSDDV